MQHLPAPTALRATLSRRSTQPAIWYIYTSFLRWMTTSTRAAGYTATVAVPRTPSTRPDDAATRTKAHHKKGKGFQNPWDSYTRFTGPQFAGMLIKRRWEGKAHVSDKDSSAIPVRKPEFLPTRETPKLRATWLGHACYFVEFPGGLRVLFDPVFTESCSPFQWLGSVRIIK